MVRGWGEGSGSARLIIDSNSDATTTTRDRSRRRGINDLTLDVNEIGYDCWVSRRYTTRDATQFRDAWAPHTQTQRHCGVRR